MNVSVTQAPLDVGNAQTMRKNILIASKDFKAGDEIYKEEPVVAALDPDLESKGSYCSHCLRKIDSAMSLHFADDPLETAYCSKPCQAKARAESHNLLFGLDPPLPTDPSQLTSSMDSQQNRRKAQEKLVASLRENSKAIPMLVAKFLSRQVAAETAKFGISATGTSPITGSDGTSNEKYSLFDHIERLRYLEQATQDDDMKLLSNVMETAMSGLEQFITDERYTILRGKMAYNAIGVCVAGGRSDKPAPKLRPEDLEETRTPYGTGRQTGSGFYQVSSYLSHSCRPSTRPSFPEGTSTLHLIANRAINKGEELTMAYVDVSHRSGETVHEARLRRRKSLARGWRFACTCPRCVEEGPQDNNPREEKNRDESKVEVVVNRYDATKTREGEV